MSSEKKKYLLEKINDLEIILFFDITCENPYLYISLLNEMKKILLKN